MKVNGRINALKRTLQRWIAADRSRRELASLSDHMLKDIGISRADAEREASRPFWDLDSRGDASLRRSRRATRTQSCNPECCSAR